MVTWRNPLECDFFMSGSLSNKVAVNYLVNFVNLSTKLKTYNLKLSTVLMTFYQI